LGGTLALACEPLWAGERLQLLIDEGLADGLLGGIQLGGELGDAAALVQEGVQAGAEVGVAEACGLLVEVAVVGVGDGEAAAEDQTARRADCWGCFPCARGAGSPTTPRDPP
jgi:hypothetical protein